MRTKTDPYGPLARKPFAALLLFGVLTASAADY
jgi:hypothetical protein